MPEWTSAPIRDLLAETFAGEWGDNPEPSTARVLRATDIDDDGNITKNGAPRRITSSIIVRKGLKDGDTLLEASGGSTDKPVGRVAYFDGNRCRDGVYLSSNFFKTLRPKKDHDPKFVFWKLHWFYRQNKILAFQQQTTGIINLKFEEYLSASVSVPSSAIEQEKIAQILDILDTQIRQTEALIAKLEHIKQGLLTDLLTRGIGQNGQLRPTPDQAPHLYKDSPLGLVPREWDIVAIDSVSELVTSGARDWARFYSEEGPKFIRIGNLTREHINFRFDSLVNVLPPRDGESQRTRLEVGDVLISITADLGITAVVNEGIGEAYINQHIALVRPRDELVNARFLGHFIASPTCQKFINALNDAGAKAGLNLPTIRSILVIVPIRQEQDSIQEALDTVDSRIRQAKKETAKLRLKKSGLMDDLLSGNVRVTRLLEAVARADDS